MLYTMTMFVIKESINIFFTYNVNQDHIELHFGALRAACGDNNNHTVRQFIAAYKRLTMRHNVEGGLVNCTGQDSTKLLHVTLDIIVHTDDVQRDTLDLVVTGLYDLEY